MQFKYYKNNNICTIIKLVCFFFFFCVSYIHHYNNIKYTSRRNTCTRALIIKTISNIRTSGAVPISLRFYCIHEYYGRNLLFYSLLEKIDCDGEEGPRRISISRCEFSYHSAGLLMMSDGQMLKCRENRKENVLFRLIITGYHKRLRSIR